MIDATAVIDPKAEIASDCVIGAYCVVGPNVRIGSGTELHSHVVLDGHLTVGEDCNIYPFACLGKQTQDLKFKGEVTYASVGDRTVIREYVTINCATGGGDCTRVGSDCLIQSYCHVAHDCQVGDHVIMSSGAMLSGHVEVGDYAIVSGYTGVVQFVRIGACAMVGGYSKLIQDVLPYCIADGIPAEIRVPNKVGMERRGMTRETIDAVRHALQVIIHDGHTSEAAAAELQDAAAEHPQVREMLDFMAGTQRGLARPKSR
jgi:UDP-N-acetylglucosamine acyltransferase